MAGDFRLNVDQDWTLPEDLGDEGDEQEEVGDEGEQSEATTPQVKASKPDPERAALREEVAREYTQKEVQELKSTVGRLQSMLARMPANDKPSKEIESRLAKEFGSVNELLATIVNQADDTVFDPAFKAQIREAAEKARRQAERDALRDEILEEVKPAPQQQAQLQPHQVMEAQILQSLQANGLDADELDWKAVEEVWVGSKYNPEAVLDSVQDQIVDLLTEARLAQRRQSTKDKTKQSPTPTGATTRKTGVEKLHDQKASFADKHAALDALLNS